MKKEESEFEIRLWMNNLINQSKDALGRASKRFTNPNTRVMK